MIISLHFAWIIRCQTCKACDSFYIFFFPHPLFLFYRHISALSFYTWRHRFGLLFVKGSSSTTFIFSWIEKWAFLYKTRKLFFVFGFISLNIYDLIWFQLHIFFYTLSIIISRHNKKLTRYLSDKQKRRTENHNKLLK